MKLLRYPEGIDLYSPVPPKKDEWDRVFNFLDQFKNHTKEIIYGIGPLIDDDLVDFYNICLNYAAYITSLLKMPNNQLIMFAPGKSADFVRENLNRQLRLCNIYIQMWKDTIDIKQDLKKMS